MSKTIKRSEMAQVVHCLYMLLGAHPNDQAVVVLEKPGIESTTPGIDLLKHSGLFVMAPKPIWHIS